jgi:hypothetical protein
MSIGVFFISAFAHNTFIFFKRILCAHLKGQCHEIFCFRFFSGINFPQAPEKFAEIFASQGAPPVSMTLVAKLPPASTTPAANFATISACVVDTGDKFATSVKDADGKLPPVSTT